MARETSGRLEDEGWIGREEGHQFRPHPNDRFLSPLYLHLITSDYLFYASITVRPDLRLA